MDAPLGPFGRLFSVYLPVQRPHLCVLTLDATALVDMQHVQPGCPRSVEIDQSKEDSATCTVLQMEGGSECHKVCISWLPYRQQDMLLLAES